jgi:hypothetical protein
MKKSILIPIVLIALAAGLCVSCSGGGESQGTSSGEAEKSAKVKSPAKATLSPAELGQKISDIYLEAMTELVNLLQNKSDAAVVKPDVEVMKESYVQQLVALGRQREALDAAGRAVVDSQVRMKMNSLYRDPVFTSFNELQQHYFQNRDFHKIVLSFNIITQYSMFELLKKQEPKEAARLGIQ